MKKVYLFFSSVLFSLILCLMILFCSCSKADNNIKITENEISKIIEPYGDKVSVDVKNVDNSWEYSINNQQQFKSASMIKLLILTTILDKVDNNQLDFKTRYEIPSQTICGGDGYIGKIDKNLMGDEDRFPNDLGKLIFNLEDICRMMIMFSDNTATNFLIDLVGMDTINNKAQSLGLEQTKLNRHMMEKPVNGDNYMCTKDATFILNGIYNHTIASNQSCNKAEEFLLSQCDSTALSYGFDKVGVKFGHKCGDLTDIRHDGGIVYSKNPFTIVVFTKDMSYDDGNRLMNQISEVVANSLCK